MKKKLRLLSGTALLSSIPLLAPVTPALAEDPLVNRLLASQCAQCHGTNGYALGDFDEIAGEDARDMYEDLTDMKGEDRPENIMDHQALGYTDDQIRRIASFYATLPEQEPDGDEYREENEYAEDDKFEQEDEDEEEDEE